MSTTSSTWYVADIEADNLLDSITKIHCICVRDPDSGESWDYGPDQLDEALKRLHKPDYLVFHNAIGYDVPALKKILNWSPREGQKIRDTLVWVRICYPDRKKDDKADGRKIIAALNGGHSLEDWGVRLGHKKMQFTGEWSTFTPEMLQYCHQDVVVGAEILKMCRSFNVPEPALIDEHLFALEGQRLSDRGFAFDTAHAEAFAAELLTITQDIEGELRSLFPAKSLYTEMKKPAFFKARFSDGTEDTFPTKEAITEAVKTRQPGFYEVEWPDGSVSKYVTKKAADDDRKERGIKPSQWKLKKVEGCKVASVEPGPPWIKETVVEFNPGSRPQVRKALYERYKWVSSRLTETGVKKLLLSEGTFEELVLDYGALKEEILRSSGLAEGNKLADYLMAKKMLSQLATGPQAWLKKVRDGRIHHRMNPIGCVTFRVAHSGPNLGQNPSIHHDKATGEPLKGVPGRFGWESRRCFVASEGMVMVGTDLAGIEARMLAHYLSPIDGGAYIKQVLEGDIHALNCASLQAIAGYKVGRNESKTPFYAHLYGIGDLKQGRQFVSLCVDAEAEWQSFLAFYKRKPDKITRSHHIKGRKIAFNPSEMAFARIGAKVKAAFEQGIEGYGELNRRVQAAGERGFISPLDGRHIPVRHKHSALNTLFQGAGAIIAKRWTIDVMATTRREALPVHLLAFVHDELQQETYQQHTERLVVICKEAIKRTTEHYSIALPLDCESRVGYNWAETH